MPNKPVPAAGEAMLAVNTAFSRRRFLGGVAVTAIPSTAIAAEAMTSPQELPIDAATRLSAELAEVMNEYLDGRFHAVVYPSDQTERPVAFIRTKRQTALERFDFHLAEFKKAAEELDPRIGDWLVRDHTSAGEGCSILISAFRTTGWYEGDGFYEAGKKNWNGSKTEYKVRLLADRVDGERLFEVTCPGERMQLIETRLNTFIGRRLS